MPQRRFWIGLLLLAGAVSAVVAVGMRSAQHEAVQAAYSVARELERPRVDIPEVAQTLRALKLVTVEVRASVESVSSDESWRGDVAAKVRAPVTYYYGVDLAELRPDDLTRDALTGAVHVRVPRPRRLATEVLGADERTTVDVSGLRLRDLSGEFYLGRARAGLYDAARRAPLSAADEQQMEDTTRRQLAVLVQTIARVREVAVVFIDVEGVAESGKGEVGSGNGPGAPTRSAGAGNP